MLLPYGEGDVADVIDRGDVSTKRQGVIWMNQQWQALGHLAKHRVVFGDFKLSNVLLEQVGTELRSKLGDFVFTRPAVAPLRYGEPVDGTTYPPEAQGTRHSEVYEKSPQLAEKVDTWSFGDSLLLFYTSLSWRLPGNMQLNQFISKYPIIFENILRVVEAHVHPAVAEVIRACLTLDPAQRPTMEELAKFRFFQDPDGVAAEIKSDFNIGNDVYQLVKVLPTHDKPTQRLLLLSAEGQVRQMGGFETDYLASGHIVETPMDGDDIQEECGLRNRPLIYISSAPSSGLGYSMALFSGAEDDPSYASFFEILKAVAQPPVRLLITEREFGDDSSGHSLSHFVEIRNFGLLSAENRATLFKAAQAMMGAVELETALPKVAGGASVASAGSSVDPVGYLPLLFGEIDRVLAGNPQNLFVFHGRVRSSLDSFMGPPSAHLGQVKLLFTYFQDLFSTKSGGVVTYIENESARQHFFILLTHLSSYFRSSDLLEEFDRLNAAEMALPAPRPVHLIPYIPVRPRTHSRDTDSNERRAYVQLGDKRFVFSNLAVLGDGTLKGSYGEGTYGIVRGGKGVAGDESAPPISKGDLESADRVVIKKTVKPVTKLYTEMFAMYEFYFQTSLNAGVGDSVLSPLGIVMYGDGKKRNVATFIPLCEGEFSEVAKLKRMGSQASRDHLNGEMRVGLIQLAEAIVGTHAMNRVVSDFKYPNALTQSQPDGSRKTLLADLGSSYVAGRSPVIGIAKGGTYPGPEHKVPSLKPTNMTPEQDKKTDVWSFGVNLLNAVLGQQDFGYDRYTAGLVGHDPERYMDEMFGPAPDRNTGKFAVMIANVRLKYGDFWAQLISDCMTVNLDSRPPMTEILARLQTGQPPEDAHAIEAGRELSSIVDRIALKAEADLTEVASTSNQEYQDIMAIFTRNQPFTVASFKQLAQSFRGVILIGLTDREGEKSELMELLPVMRAMIEGYKRFYPIPDDGYLEKLFSPLTTFSLCAAKDFADVDPPYQFSDDGSQYVFGDTEMPKRDIQVVTLPPHGHQEFWGMITTGRPEIVSVSFSVPTSFEHWVNLSAASILSESGADTKTVVAARFGGRVGMLEVFPYKELSQTKPAAEQLHHQLDEIMDVFQMVLGFVSSSHDSGKTVGEIRIIRVGGSLYPRLPGDISFAPMTAATAKADRISAGLLLLQLLTGIKISPSEFGLPATANLIRRILMVMPPATQPVVEFFNEILFKDLPMDDLLQVFDFDGMAQRLKDCDFHPNQFAHQIRNIVWDYRLNVAGFGREERAYSADPASTTRDLIHVDGDTRYGIQFETPEGELPRCRLEKDTPDVDISYFWSYFTEPLSSNLAAIVRLFKGESSV